MGNLRLYLLKCVAAKGCWRGLALARASKINAKQWSTFSNFFCCNHFFQFLSNLTTELWIHIFISSHYLDLDPFASTGKYLLLILASTNPKYDKRLFIELRVQYMKIPSSENVKKMFSRNNSTNKCIVLIVLIYLAAIFTTKFSYLTK